LYQVTVAVVVPVTAVAALISPAWNLMLAQSLPLREGVGVEIVGSGRKPLGNGVGDEYEMAGVGTDATGPPLVSIHGAVELGAAVGCAVVVDADAQPPTSSPANGITNHARRRTYIRSA
jgi:hypothetical protein